AIVVAEAREVGMRAVEQGRGHQQRDAEPGGMGPDGGGGGMRRHLARASCLGVARRRAAADAAPACGGYRSRWRGARPGAATSRSTPGRDGLFVLAPWARAAAVAKRPPLRQSAPLMRGERT